MPEQPAGRSKAAAGRRRPLLVPAGQDAMRRLRAFRRSRAAAAILLVGLLVVVGLVLAVPEPKYSRRAFLWIGLGLVLVAIDAFDLRLLMRSWILRLAATLYLYLFVTLLWSPDATAASVRDYGWRMLASLLFMAAAAEAAIAWRDGGRRLLVGAAALVAAAALLSMMLHYAAHPFPASRLDGLAWTNPNSAGVVFAAFASGTLAFALNRGAPMRLRLAGGAIGAVLLIAALLTQSRASVVALAAALAAAAALARAWRVLLALSAGGLVLALAVVAILDPTHIGLLLGHGDSFRPLLWSHFAELALQRPWLGYSMTFDGWVLLPNGKEVAGAHNAYLEVQIFGGLPATILYLAFLAAFVRAVFRVYRRDRDVMPAAFLVFILTHGIFENLPFVHELDWHWLTFLLPIGLVAGREMTIGSDSRGLDSAALTGMPPPAQGQAASAIRALGKSRLWFDLTTSINLRNIPPVGITRVESRYAAELAERLPERVHFCRFDPDIGRFRTVPPRVARAVLDPDRPVTAPGPAQVRERGKVLTAGRAAERWFRLSRRRLAWRVLRRASPLRRLYYREARFRPGDLLILSGETWRRTDLANLGRLRIEIGISLIVFCHDLVPVKFPQFHDVETARSFEPFAQFMVRRSSLILCNSQATRHDVLEYARQQGIAACNARVIPLGHDLAPPSPRPPPSLPAHVRPGRYVLYVSTIQVRKNHRLLYQLWRRLAEERGDDVPNLVLVGIVGWLVDDLLRQLRHDPLLARHATILTGAGDAELSWLYENCLFTVYPSLYEGWGLPISESLAHGKVCVASTTSAMPEAGLALHLDPLDGDAWYREIRSLIYDSDRLASLEARIKAGYRKVDWSQASDALLKEILTLVAERPISASPLSSGRPLVDGETDLGLWQRVLFASRRNRTRGAIR